MSRALFINLDEDVVIARCLKEKVDVSALERIPSGGVRLVCGSSEGAELMRRKLKTKLISGEPVRARHRPSRPLW